MYCKFSEPLFCDCLGQVARLFKGDEVADWNSLRNDPSATFVRRMYNAATAKFMSLDKKWDALPEPRDLVFH